MLGGKGKLYSFPLPCGGGFTVSRALRWKIFEGAKEGITNQACKRGFFADRMNRRFQCQLVLGRLRGFSGNEALRDPGVVNAQELVLSGGHIDEIGLAIGPFLSRNWYTGSSAGALRR